MGKDDLLMQQWYANSYLQHVFLITSSTQSLTSKRKEKVECTRDISLGLVCSFFPRSGKDAENAVNPGDQDKKEDEKEKARRDGDQVTVSFRGSGFGDENTACGGDELREVLLAIAVLIIIMRFSSSFVSLQ
ncbi:hypothetical protein D5086_011758 [Populus alba]|uniref:Uncharacterized protein n=1 Tax=Populus alba TaxID=43335 RepID=A0ACC4CEL9_POPAL